MTMQQSDASNGMSGKRVKLDKNSTQLHLKRNGNGTVLMDLRSSRKFGSAVNGRVWGSYIQGKARNAANRNGPPLVREFFFSTAGPS